MLTISASSSPSTKTYSIKWKIEDPQSASASNYVEETFDLTIDCINNALTKTGTGLVSQTYTVEDPALQLFPQFGISTTYDRSRCPLTYSYYVKDTNGNWILASSNTAPFTAFVTSTG